PEYTGPVATVGDQAAPTVEKPEFKGGVNAVMALVHELPEYTGPLATVDDQAAPTVEKPEFKLSSLASDQGKIPDLKQEVTKQETAEQSLPATGESQSDTALFLAGVSLALSAIFVAKTKKD
uniref:SIALI-17 repeat-containing surface protein n=1 Tax=Streptococcus oralis TaxID=1303 RepID=UPI001C1EE8A6